MSRLALITGASSGIGKETALFMARRGYHVIACVRRTRDGETLLEEGNRSRNLEYFVVDINVEADVIGLRERIAARFTEDDSINFFTLINNAGVSPVAPIETVSMEELNFIFQTNVFAVVRLIQAMLPYLQYTTGRIVNISSGSGVMAIPFSGAYSMSKFAVEALSDVLRVEFKQFGIKVIVVEPGLIKTPIHEKNAFSMEKLIGEFDSQQRDHYEKALRTYVDSQGRMAKTATPAIEVSKIIVKAIECPNPKARYGAGKDAKALRWVHWLLTDRIRDRIVARLCGW